VVSWACCPNPRARRSARALARTGQRLPFFKNRTPGARGATRPTFSRLQAIWATHPPHTAAAYAWIFGARAPRRGEDTAPYLLCACEVAPLWAAFPQLTCQHV